MEDFEIRSDGNSGDQPKKPYQIPEVLDQLEVIKTAVLAAAPETEAIYLFGSYAYGQPHKESDLDILVVVPKNESRSWVDLTFSIRCKIKEIKYWSPFPMDLVVKKSNIFWSNINSTTISGEVYSKGALIYDRLSQKI
jgi:predicted nucleotidyltransferase